MNKLTNALKQNTHFFIISTLLFVSIVLGSSIYFIQTRIYFQELSRTLLINESESIYLNIKTQIFNDFNKLNLLTFFISQQDQPQIEKFKKDLIQQKQGGITKTYVYTNTTGMSFLNNGSTYDSSDREYFKRSMQGESCITGPYKSRFSNELVMTLSVPVIKNDEIIGVLKVAQNIDESVAIINTYKKRDDFAIYIFNSTGNFIINAGITNQTNLFDYINKETLEDQESNIQQMQRDILAGKDGIITITHANHGKRYLFYKKLMDDTFIAMSIPVNYAYPYFKNITVLSICFILLTILLFSLVIIYTITIKNDAAKKLKNVAVKLEDEVHIRTAEFSKQTALLSCVFNTLPDIIFYNDLEGHYLGCNEAAANFFATSEENIVGKKSIAHSSTTFDYELNVSTITEGTEIIEQELCYQDGSIHYIETNRLQYCDENNIPLGILTISRDVTVKKEAEISLKLSREAALQANQAKQSFLANMSHEIRTPLNAIIGMCYLCMQTNLSPAQYDYIKKAHNASQNLLGIINDILDFSKIEAGKLELENNPFSLTNLISLLVDMTQLNAERKGLELNYSIEPDVPTILIGDALRLNQVLLNLVSNALKFTEKGHVLIGIEKVVSQENNIVLRFYVEDTGIGLSPRAQNKLFNPFVQADASTTRQYGGTGLGLVISKQLVEMMGGEINLISAANAGSTFYFTAIFKLPKTSDLQQNILNMLEQTETTDEFLDNDCLKDTLVLLVEDNDINQMIAQEMLQQKKGKVDIADNGETAIKMIHEKAYDLILMDIQMPIMDGITATIEIRKEKEFDHIPIIAMTAHAMQGDYDRSIEAGMQDHITKPIDPNILYSTIKKWLSQNQS